MSVPGLILFALAAWVTGSLPVALGLGWVLRRFPPVPVGED